MIIGLTGRVGSGKSHVTHTVRRFFNAQLIDLDIVGHKLLHDSDVVIAITEAFGLEILDSKSKQIRRDHLRQIVFASESNLQQLNQIIHPRIRKTVIQDLATIGDTLISGALIHEIGLDYTINFLIVIDAEDSDIHQHIGDKFRIARFQRSREAYRSNADLIVTNQFDDQLPETLWKHLQAHFPKRNKAPFAPG